MGASLPPFIPNYDEALIPPYTLPPLLTGENGQTITSFAQWQQERRPELLRLFCEHIYGEQPPPLPFSSELIESGPAFGGEAVREQVTLSFHDEQSGREASIHLLLYRPSNLSGAAPVFLGLNFRGNASTTEDPTVLATRSWCDPPPNRAEQAHRWPYRLALRAGYAVGTFYYGDVAPDSAAHWRRGLPGGALPAGYDWKPECEPGAIAWWAWGLSRALDYLTTRPTVYNPSQVVLLGHSRQGKAALWAAAQDERFALAISNNSGCTGAALARRRIGETIVRITTAFPHWFCPHYRSYAEREAALPVDQHQLLALIAPRPLYIASASEDHWADPRGEYLAALAASPVYDLAGCPAGLGSDWPPVGQPCGSQIGYHRRQGGHDITPWDWQAFLNFANRHLKRSQHTEG